MLLRMLQYDTEVVYHKGKEMYIADTLSRSYLQHSGGTDNFGAVNAVRHLPISTERMQMLKTCTDRDEMLKHVIQRGWPESRHEVPASVHAYFSMRDELAVSDGLIFRGERVVIPEGMRKLTKECLHRSHLEWKVCYEEHVKVCTGRTWRLTSDKSLRTARHADRMRGRNRNKPS